MRFVRCRTVAKVLSIGFDVWMCFQCSAGYTHVSYQFGPFATQNEAPYILDSLLMTGAAQKIRDWYADAGGFTDHVFAASFSKDWFQIRILLPASLYRNIARSLGLRIFHLPALSAKSAPFPIILELKARSKRRLAITGLST